MLFNKNKILFLIIIILFIAYIRFNLTYIGDMYIEIFHILKKSLQSTRKIKSYLLILNFTNKSLEYNCFKFFHVLSFLIKLMS
jgi:hypothetical protein